MTGQVRAALIEQALSTATSLILAAGLYVAFHPPLRHELTRLARVELRRLSGAERRAWLRSPAAEFARRRRSLLVAQEWAATADEPITVERVLAR